MKLLLTCLLFTPFLFAQKSNKKRDSIKSEFDSLLIGEWTLYRVEFYDDSYFYSDPKGFNSQLQNPKKIRITSDSILILPDSTQRFYIPPHKYLYRVEYDKLLNISYLKFYTGKPKRLFQKEMYEIRSSTQDQLVISSYYYLHEGLESASFSIVYTYRKAGVTAVLDALKGKWVLDAAVPSTFLSDQDSTEHVFVRMNQDEANPAEGYSMELTFLEDRYKHVLQVEQHDRYSGAYGILNFHIDPANNRIYFIMKNGTVAYSYQMTADEKLVLRRL
jgi:hypothetical protein